jgi:hypothetical protein
MSQPCVQTNVYHGNDEIDTSADWELVLEYDDTGANPFVNGPVDLATARAGWVSALSRPNVRKATIQRVGA